MYLKINKNKIEIKTINHIGQKILSYFTDNSEIGLYYPNTNRITTFLAKDVTDVLVLNEQNQIVEIYKDVKRNKILKTNRDNKKTSIIKAPYNTSKKLKVGSILVFKNEDIV